MPRPNLLLPPRAAQPPHRERRSPQPTTRPSIDCAFVLSPPGNVGCQSPPMLPRTTSCTPGRSDRQSSSNRPSRRRDPAACPAIPRSNEGSGVREHPGTSNRNSASNATGDMEYRGIHRRDYPIEIALPPPTAQPSTLAAGMVKGALKPQRRARSRPRRPTAEIARRPPTDRHTTPAPR
jgi:hypothetical protein